MTTLPKSVQNRDRRIIYGAIIVLLVLLWMYQAYMAIGMMNMDMGMSMDAGRASDMSMTSDMANDMSSTMDMPSGESTGMASTGMANMMPALTGGFLAWLIWMWSTMMLAMMLPSALPMINTYATINRKKAIAATTDSTVNAKPLVSTAYFTFGYGVLWIAFSVGAGVLQFVLHKLAVLSPMMALQSDYLAAALLIAAGVYQLTPLKRICLKYCRTPLGFIMSEYRDGNRGAFIMGLRHGLFCVGCCWVLMALLFFGGVMNPIWIVGLTLYVLLEKVIPTADWMTSAVGVALCLWGVYVLF